MTSEVKMDPKEDKEKIDSKRSLSEKEVQRLKEIKAIVIERIELERLTADQMADVDKFIIREHPLSQTKLLHVLPFLNCCCCKTNEKYKRCNETRVEDENIALE